MAPFNLSRIKATLLTSGLQKSNSALYQVINQIIDFSDNNIADINGRLTLITTGGGGGGGGGAFAPTNGTYITLTDEHVTLPFSRELLAGIGISFDDSIAHQRTINTIPGDIDHVVMSDGATPIPAPLNDGFGNFIYIAYTP